MYPKSVDYNITCMGIFFSINKILLNRVQGVLKVHYNKSIKLHTLKTYNWVQPPIRENKIFLTPLLTYMNQDHGKRYI